MIAIIVAAALYLVLTPFALVFAFHCGYIYGRHGISAHDYWKQRRHL